MRVAFLTLGCKVNYYETGKIKEEFEKDGYEIVDFDDCDTEHHCGCGHCEEEAGIIFGH